MYAPFPMS